MTKIMEVHQILPGLQSGDAISNHAFALKRLLRSWGYPAEIYAKDFAGEVARDCKPFNEFNPGPQTLTIYHYSIGSEELTPRFLQAPGKRMVIYHNITPDQCIAPYSEKVALACRRGREGLAALSCVADMAVADSTFNCQELVEHGFREPRVMPILLDFHNFDATPPCPRILEKYGTGWANFLFVGRLSPNKRQDDVIRVFAHYRHWINRRSRLFLVGNWSGMEAYSDDLHDLVRELGIEDHVVFPGHVRLDELEAYYRLADVFVCMSEHEGFCVPLLEALYHDIPVIAYDAAAVPETLGDASIVVRRKDYAALAELAHLLISDQDLRDHVLRRQGERLADYRPGRIASQFRNYIEVLVGMGSDPDRPSPECRPAPQDALIAV
jgi:glycosyltransferase involved in cell wall biosynthesis